MSEKRRWKRENQSRFTGCSFREPNPILTIFSSELNSSHQVKTSLNDMIHSRSTINKNSEEARVGYRGVGEERKLRLLGSCPTQIGWTSRQRHAASFSVKWTVKQWLKARLGRKLLRAFKILQLQFAYPPPLALKSFRHVRGVFITSSKRGTGREKKTRTK